jgi:serine/threonine protein kinase
MHHTPGYINCLSGLPEGHHLFPFYFFLPFAIPPSSLTSSALRCCAAPTPPTFTLALAHAHSSCLLPLASPSTLATSSTVDVFSSYLSLVKAVKWLGLPTSSSRNQVSPGKHAQRLAKLEHEADMHARVSDHPNILTLHRTIIDDKRKCRWMVSDYISGGDVFNAQTQRNPFRRNNEHTRSICLQLIDAVAHCHRQRVYHCNIKPENLLLSADGNTIYLSDFGCSTTKRYCTDMAGTTEYMAPGML